jgi:type VI protein secretion system component VasK
VYTSLREVVSVQGTVVSRRPNAPYQPSKRFLDLLGKGLQIGEVFYPGGRATPSFTFSVRGKTGPDVPRISLKLDEQPPVVWATGVPPYKEFTWNVPSGKHVELTGAYGVDQELTIPGNGPWAPLRLFDRGVRAAPDLFEWSIDTPNASNQGSARTIKVQVERGQDVLSRSIFSGLRQCAMIDP